MMFEIPDEVADQFVRDVPAEERSGVITELILHRRPKRRLTNEEWDAACAAANADPALLQLEKEWDVCAGDGLEGEPNDW